MKDHSAFNILRLLETPGVGVVKANAILTAIGSEFETQQLQRYLSAKQLNEYISLEDKVRQVWDQMCQKKVKFISLLDENYPGQLREKLQKHTPPLLMALGNTDLLKKTSAGFCGSRKASDKGLATAKDCAEQLAQEGINVVSGYAAGVDMATHQAALETDGTTTLVLCEGIFHFKIKRDLKALWDWERIVVVSEFLPGVPWSVRNAMQRNKTICALTSAMILIESSSKGGSIEAGRACLKMGVPLFAPVYKGMPETAVGNRELLSQGAHELYKNSITNRANMTEIYSIIVNQGSLPSSTPSKNKSYPVERPEFQLSLFEKKEQYKTN